MLFFPKKKYIYIYIYCKDQIWLESKIVMDPGPRNPNNKFIECGRESSSESWAKILDFSVKKARAMSVVF